MQTIAHPHWRVTAQRNRFGCWIIIIKKAKLHKGISPYSGCYGCLWGLIWRVVLWNTPYIYSPKKLLLLISVCCQTNASVRLSKNQPRFSQQETHVAVSVNYPWLLKTDTASIRSSLKEVWPVRQNCSCTWKESSTSRFVYNFNGSCKSSWPQIFVSMHNISRLPLLSVSYPTFLVTKTFKKMKEGYSWLNKQNSPKN